MARSAQVVDIPDSDWMFPLPPEAKKLNCGGDIAYARQRAREERKWVLVNLQSADGAAAALFPFGGMETPLRDFTAS